MKRIAWSFIAPAAILAALTAPLGACSRATPFSAADMVAKTAVIVRARAVSYAAGSDSLSRIETWPSPLTVVFRVFDVLKGEGVPDRIRLPGTLGDRDDFNDQDSPYSFVRPTGRGGSCSTDYYKRDGQFLLFLDEVEGGYRVAREALAPVNEQVTGPTDPWVQWVRAFVAGMRYERAHRG